MSEKALTYDRIREALISAIPELNDHIKSKLGSYYDFKIDAPEAYPIFEDVVQKLVYTARRSPRRASVASLVSLF